MIVSPVRFGIGMAFVVYGVSGLLVLWHIIKYGEAGIFHKRSRPSLLGDEPPTYEKGNLTKWFREVRERFMDQVELERQRELERIAKQRQKAAKKRK